jgi:hypothetical protein
VTGQCRMRCDTQQISRLGTTLHTHSSPIEGMKGRIERWMALRPRWLD